MVVAGVTAQGVPQSVTRLVCQSGQVLCKRIYTEPQLEAGMKSYQRRK